MRITLLLRSPLAAIVLVWSLLSIHLSAALHLCEATLGCQRLETRFGASKFSIHDAILDALKANPAALNHPRFHVNGVPSTTAYIMQMRDALGRIERIAPGAIDEDAAKAFLEMMGSNRILDATSVSLETISEGYGQIARRMVDRFSGPNDAGRAQAKLKGLISDMGHVCLNNALYAGKYDLAHLLRDANHILDNLPPNFPMDNFVANLASRTGGVPLEYRAAASKVGENLKALDADKIYGKGADIVTDQAVYSCKSFIHNVTSLVDNTTGLPTKPAGEDVIAAIKKSQDAGKPYVFLVGSGAKSDATGAFNHMNTILVRDGYSPMSVTDNIELVPIP
jgi:hypothetical protein